MRTRELISLQFFGVEFYCTGKSLLALKVYKNIYFCDGSPSKKNNKLIFMVHKQTIDLPPLLGATRDLSGRNH